MGSGPVLIFGGCTNVGVLVSAEGEGVCVFSRELYGRGILETVRERASLDEEETGATLLW